ncbi:MocR-like pyridoxine biosynthesis transcription factor PdxR [Butyrivibrio sp. WCE2006]|uniref:MocR-like pyridoxine biosynthesis transcription factor PdxR n=1 Tax=Butyrivibrio sp. WCE2006 TaxID=1410611 RepID=UPI0005D279BB|nr:PLP-dependent aminotransferase family protein [Butyrivibrio sp. WCE2006]
MDTNKRYLKVYEQVREDIINGRYPVNTKLPSKRVMSEAMGVSVITVEHAYELLIEEGYITAKEKSGYFVTFDDKEIYTGLKERKPAANKKTEETGEKGNTIKQVAPAAAKFSYSIYAKTVRRVLSEYENYIMTKSPKNGTFELRNAIAHYLSRSRRLEVSSDQIIIGAGAEYLYGLIVQTFGRDIIYGIENPSYPKIQKVYEAGGANIEMLNLGNDGVDSDELWKGKMKVLHISPYRSFPSGVTASAAKKREYLKWSKKNDGYIVEDDFESEFTPSRKPEETIYSLDTEGRVIYVNTFTRTIGSYARCAYMVLPDELLELFNEKTGFYECPVPPLDQYVIATLIESGDFERHINKVRRQNRNKSV